MNSLPDLNWIKDSSQPTRRERFIHSPLDPGVSFGGQDENAFRLRLASADFLRPPWALYWVLQHVKLSCQIHRAQATHLYQTAINRRILE